MPARIPATPEIKKQHPGAEEMLMIKNDKRNFWELFVYDEDGNEIARSWGHVRPEE